MKNSSTEKPLLDYVTQTDNAMDLSLKSKANVLEVIHVIGTE